MNKKFMLNDVNGNDFYMRPFAQGINSDGITMGETIVELINKQKYNKLFFISAFTSERAVSGIEQCLLENSINPIKSFSFVTGIDNGMTPIDALSKIMDITENGYIFYQKESVIFHPKIYIFEGDEETAIIDGSTNCTLGGLFRNVENFNLIEFGNKNKIGVQYLTELKNEWKSLFDFTDINLFKITPQAIDYFISNNIIPIKSVPKIREIKERTTTIITDNSLIIPKRRTSKISPLFQKKRVSKKRVSNKAIAKKINLPNYSLSDDLLWISNPLKRSDLNIPVSDKTNPTGSMNFTQGAKNVNQLEYFRNGIFSELNWTFDVSTTKKHIERVPIILELIILGENKGIFETKIIHNSKTDSPQYKQNNSPTRFSWGKAKEAVNNEELLGKTAFWSKSGANGVDFILNIK